MTLPVMYEASSEARNNTVLATSWGVPNRLIGTEFLYASVCACGREAMKSVSMNPGETQLTVILRRATSRESDLTSAVMPALEAA